MVTIYAPIKATVAVPTENGKTATKTIMLPDGYKIDVENIIDAVKATAGIVDSFAKGYHFNGMSEDENGNIHISVVKSD